MGNPGCFERYHAKGKRIEHEWEALSVRPIEMTPEILALERKVQQHRLQLKKAAEAAIEEEAKRHAHQLAEEERLQKAIMAERKRQERAREASTRTEPEEKPPVEDLNVKTSGWKNIHENSPNIKSARLCAVAGCPNPVFKTQLYCGNHCTAQNLLSQGKNAKEAAKILADIQAHAQQMKKPSTFLSKIFREFQDLKHTHK